MKAPGSLGPAIVLVALASLAGCGEPDGGAAPGAVTASGPTGARDPLAGTVASSPPEPSGFTSVLRAIVVDGRVDYDMLQDRRAGLDAYLQQLAGTSPQALEASSREARLAFWINAYNACMLRLVVENRPLEDAGGVWNRLKNTLAGRPTNSVWQIPDVFTRQHCRVAGEARSQDEIEHEIIRPMGDPRIHFAVNCAALSCPTLAPDAYTAEGLDAQLERQVARFMEDPSHYRLEVEDGSPVLRLNRVLEWFGQDFGGREGVAAFFAARAEPEERALLQHPDLAVRFMEYDWTLNDTGA